MTFLVLVVLWFLGLVTTHTMGGLIHILLVLDDGNDFDSSPHEPQGNLLTVETKQ